VETKKNYLEGELAVIKAKWILKRRPQQINDCQMKQEPQNCQQAF
jgi:hypothetical protein